MKLLVVVFLSLLLHLPVFGHNLIYEEEQAEALKKVEWFQSSQCRVFIAGSGDEKEKQVEDELSDYLRLKIKNNFAGIKILSNREGAELYKQLSFKEGVLPDPERPILLNDKYINDNVKYFVLCLAEEIQDNRVGEQF